MRHSLVLCLTVSALLLTSIAAAAETRTLNPDIGVNFLGLYQQSSLGSNNPLDPNHEGFSFQEAELQVAADVDPYLRAVALFSMAPDGAEYSFEPEEVFVETLGLPLLTLRAGKFKAAFGKHNQLHTHGFAFIDAPLINQALLGDEGLNDVGLGASALIPISWFSELTLQLVSARNETLFNSPRSDDLAGVAQFRNLLDLSDSTTIEVALFGALGNNANDATTNGYGTDVILKWRPTKLNRYNSVIWWTQYLRGNIGDRPQGESLGGVASWVQYQFAQRWWLQLRGEYLGWPQPEPQIAVDAIPTATKQSVLFGLFPSEFSGFRLQYDHTITGGQTDHRVAFQWNISIGAHPAHTY